MRVLDASVVVAYLIGGESFEAAAEHVADPGTSAWAPHLIDAEVGHVVRREVLAGALRPGRAQQALEDLADLPMRRASHLGLLDRAWELRANVSFYDGLYVALAERLAAPLVTLDARLARVRGLRTAVVVAR